jgi:putative transposase
MARWQLYYHVVFATKQREVALGPHAREIARRIMWDKAHDLGCLVHAIHVRPEHAHLVLSVPPSRAIAFVIGQIKGSSSHGIAPTLPPWIGNVWQEGYGVFSFREPELAVVVRYVQDQDRRHAEHQLDAEWERWQDASEIP